MSISNVSSYRPETWKSLEQDEESEKAINKARKSVGFTEDVHLTGKDATHGEVRAEQKDCHITPADVGHHVVDHAIDHAQEHAVGHALVHAGVLGGSAAVALGAGAIKLLYEGAKMIKESHEKGDAQKDALERDVARGGMLMSLDIPGCYVRAELAKTPRATLGGKIEGTPVAKVATAIDSNESIKAHLQLSADRGMNAARPLLDTGALPPNATKEQVLKALSPQAREAYEKDPAFRAGFDSMMFAKTNDPAGYKQAAKDLDERDVRYQQHHIRFSV
jgi:hypothetical protein